jgi:lipopolysaccharide transport system ATP-binding protein
MDIDATGRESIVLRGLFMGLDRPACEAMAREAGEFSGLGAFLDVPVRTYSGGMTVRLAFSIATVLQPQILLMDEWFLAGDADFMERAEGRLRALVGAADILVVATHDLHVVRRWCNRAICLVEGRIVADGPVEEVLGAEPVRA